MTGGDGSALLGSAILGAGDGGRGQGGGGRGGGRGADKGLTPVGFVVTLIYDLKRFR
jgi:hypothetical protein